MSRRRVPVARVTTVAAVVVGALVIGRGVSGPHFRSLRPGLEFAVLHGEPFCRGGSSAIAVLRLDPARMRLRVRHYSLEPEHRPLDILEWQGRTAALAVFNAGQYYPDYSYMGLLVSDGRVVSHHVHPAYKAALVASPVEGPGRARVLDLEREPLDARRPRWREIAQSFMLFDRTGTLRIRRTSQTANRTVVAEDREGRLLVITTEGAYTLHEFASLLRALPLRITQAMSMDGGEEAMLCVKVGRFRYASFGRWDGEPDPDGKSDRAPLPAVIAVTAE